MIANYCIVFLLASLVVYVKSDEDKCLQPKEVGLCRARNERFYFDKDEGSCQLFIYGGCGGNDNNFETKEECEDACSASLDSVSGVSTCAQPMETGMCRAHMPRFYFDQKEGKCVSFVYGGCMGNDNNFEEKVDCEDKCGSSSTKVETCAQPMEAGMCRSYLPRFYFDQEAGQCLSFTYGGCMGNDNNFDEEEDCIAKCVGSSSYE